MRSHIFVKLLGAFALVIAVATFTIDFAVTKAWERSLREEIQTSLGQRTAMFASRVRNASGESMQKIADEEGRAAGARATIITSAGKVLADSGANAGEMENHATRPEFLKALSGQEGMDIRHSHTLGIDFLYMARPVPGGAVRLAYPLKAIADATSRVRRTILEGSAIAVVIAILIALLAAQTISQRLRRILNFAGQIESGDLSARLPMEVTDEIGQVATALDRTARRLEESFQQIETSRRELEAVLNGMQEAVIAIAPDGRVQWANQPMERLVATGVRRQSPLVESVRDPDFLSTLQLALQTSQPQSTRATSIAPGKVFNVTAAPMPGGGAVVVLHDLTEIERVEKTRRDFIANVSHELRTPLTSIQGYAETLAETSNDEASRDFLEIIRKNASRMARLTEDLLVLAKVESGEKKPNLQPFSPAELLEDATEYFRERQMESGLTMEVHSQALKLVSADPDAIFQVFSNLIDNACKYASGSGKIEIGAEDVEGAVQFHVRDFGGGIASEHLPRLFERFYRVDKARSRESGGTGLGLAIAKHIVRAHGGTIWAESELHHGSTFFFTLPEARTGVHGNLTAS